MYNQRFLNAIKLKEQNIPPIWFMRQAGRYHSHYQKLKEKYSFEQLCKNPELAAEVAVGPVNEFDFDLAILFSDILFILEGLGMDLTFNPGPIMGQKLDKNNYKKFQDTEKAINFLEFQKKALQITREKLPKDKSLIGFVGGPWTVLNYALGKDNRINLEKDSFTFSFFKETFIPLLIQNIKLQIDGGAEIVMILDSGLQNMDTKNFEKYYTLFLKDLSRNYSDNIAYYARGVSEIEFSKLCNLNFAGLGCDSSINIKNCLKKNKYKFFQGNFDQNKMLLEKEDLKKELDIYCKDFLSLTLEERAGWICGLGHGINKNTSEKNVHFFIETIRKQFT